MSELDPILSRAFAAGRAEKPPSNEGKDRALAALGLSGPAPVAAEAQPSKPAPWRRFDGSRRWWSLGVVVLVAAGARTFYAESPAGTDGHAPPGDRALAIPALSEGAAAPMIAVTELPSAAPESAAAPMLGVADLPSAAPENVARPKVAAPELPSAAPAARRATTHVQSAHVHEVPPPASSCAGCDAPPISKAPASSLREEVEALGKASRALSERRCAGARSALADYRARFPNGRLEREADVVDIEITGRGGDVDRARAAARRFVARFPGSPYAMRLGPWLGEDGADRDVVRCLDAAP